MRTLLALLLLLPLATAIASELDALPILHAGRVKPFAIAAEESLVAVAGTAHLPGQAGPSATLDGILHDPTGWKSRPLVYVPWLALRHDLGIGEAETRAAIEQVETLRPRLTALVERKRKTDATGVLDEWSADDQAAYTLANRYAETLEVVAGRTLFLVPLAIDDAERRWVLDIVGPIVVTAAATNQSDTDRAWRFTVQEVMAAPLDQRAALLKQKDIWLSYEDLVLRPDPLLAGAPPGLAAVVAKPLDPALLYQRQQRTGPALIAAELTYTRARPFTIAWIGFILGGIAVAIGLRTRRGWYRTGIALTAIAIVATVAGLGVRTAITGLGAVTNLYETLIYVALIVAVLGLFFARMTGKGIYAVAGGIGAGLCAMVGEAMPPDLGSHIGQLQPVLRSKFWLWVHVKVVVGAYAPLVLALVLGNLVLWQAWRQRRKVTQEESRLLYRCLQWGTVLMAAGTLLGAVWADQVWGRFWGWDPKEVGALMIVLTYLIPLHLRYVGAVGPTGLAAWSVLGFLSVVWSWYGVNFILGAGLHAYAFGSGGQWIILPLAGAQVVFTTIQLIMIKRAVAYPRKGQAEGQPEGQAPA